MKKKWDLHKLGSSNVKILPWNMYTNQDLQPTQSERCRVWEAEKIKKAKKS